jgi:hypothetical protein
VRKSQITRIPQNTALRGQAWMDVDRIASVEATSEESDHPIESALLLEGRGGWRASNPGVQTIRLIFDEPQKLKRILLVFEDTENSRTQEFVLRLSPDIQYSSREMFASNGISTLLTPCGRQKSIRLNSPRSKYLN